MRQRHLAPVVFFPRRQDESGVDRAVGIGHSFQKAGERQNLKWQNDGFCSQICQFVWCLYFFSKKPCHLKRLRVTKLLHIYWFVSLEAYYEIMSFPDLFIGTSRPRNRNPHARLDRTWFNLGHCGRCLKTLVMIQNIISNGSTWHETLQHILHSEMVKIEPFDHFWPLKIFMLHIYQILAL